MADWTEEQLDAINKGGSNIIVSAGAGSGKTTVLAERVVRKIKDGVPIDSLLILTFTNQAAYEMKSRIRKNLIKNNLKEAAEKIDSAYITTFDAYALSIVKKYHYLLNIDKNIKICNSNLLNIKKREILDDIFDKFYDNDSFKKFIDDYCSKDDQSIKNEIFELNNKLDLIYDKEKYLDEYLEKYYSKEKIDSLIEEYINIIKNYIDKLKSDLLNLSKYITSNYYNEICNKLDEYLNYKKYTKLSKVDLGRLTKNNSTEGAGEAKDRLKNTINKLVELTKYENIDEMREEILSMKQYVEVVINILKEYNDSIRLYKENNSLYEFVDISKNAITLVKEKEEVRNDLKYNEIMIDEYQDTNDLQEEFISYIQDNNVYMVGDIKQSIYRFRNANPDLFRTKYENYSKNIDGIKIDLNKNFRSREEVVSNINLIFDDIMDEKLGGADYKKSHKMIFGNLKYLFKGKKKSNSNIEILNYDSINNYSKDEIEAFIIINDIKNKMKNEFIFENDELRNIKYSDFTILMDRTTKFDLYKKIFEYEGIPVSIIEDEKINNNMELKIFNSIINFMTTDDIELKRHSFTSILRSYLFEIDDQIIFDYLKTNDFSYLDNYMIDVNNITPYELTNYIIDKFNFYENMIKVGNIDDREIGLNYLLDFSLDMTNQGLDIYDYSQNLTKLLEETEPIKIEKKIITGDSVKMMNIHKSKGLEFPICYYSGLTSEFNFRELNDKINYDNHLGIIMPILDSSLKDTFCKSILKFNYYTNEISEKIRLFYVALTRAKEKIILVLPNKEISNLKLDFNTKLNYRSIGDMVYSIFNSLNSYSKNIDLEKINLTKDYKLIKNYNYKDNIELTNDMIQIKDKLIEKVYKDEKHFSKENKEIYSIDDYKNIEYGKYIHNVFEHIDFNNPKIDKYDNYTKNKILKFLDLDILKGVKNIYKEYEFIYYDNNVELHGIIDLLLEYGDYFRIVDYKLKNIQDDEYINQLKGYKKYIEFITGKETKICLYSIIDEKLIEI